MKTLKNIFSNHILQTSIIEKIIQKNLFKRKVDEPYLTKILNKINDNKNIIFTENKSKVFFIKLKFKIKIFYYFLLKIISPKFILNKNENIKIGVSFVEGINKYKRSDLFWHDKIN